MMKAMKTLSLFAALFSFMTGSSFAQDAQQGCDQPFADQSQCKERPACDDEDCGKGKCGKGKRGKGKCDKEKGKGKGKGKGQGKGKGKGQGSGKGKGKSQG